MKNEREANSQIDLKKFSWIKQHAPCFRIQPDHVDIIYEPAEFYDTLKDQVSRAKDRIVLSSLYIGTGPKEVGLIDEIEKALKSNDRLKVTILTDFTRGTRGDQNTCTLVQKLKNYNNVTICMYHSPDLRGILKKILPQKFNEVVGLSHMKICVFDDNLIMTGANLSADYFTNRQDRYFHLTHCKQLANFLSGIVQVVCEFSFHLNKNGLLYFHKETEDFEKEIDFHPFDDNIDPSGENFRTKFHRSMAELVEKFKNEPTSSQNDQKTTVEIYPLIQMFPINIDVDNRVTHQLITDASESATIHITSGYFNLTPDFEDAVLQSTSTFSILTASPEVNGFFGARGVLGAIPDAYTLIEKQFFEKLDNESKIEIFEYFRKDWTYHAKGMWFYFENKLYPSLTLIGSPNYGFRSVFRDLEVELAILTDDLSLQMKLHRERLNLYKKSTKVSDETFQRPSRRIPLWVKFVTKYIRKFF
ncbi:DgyrCDS5007 [Dimorphilus gyrociliatus]|uniref:CDP-diacylglycerol--glycerol-3-phosphate 3-phosphatidyltransferase n=1 Tax=Dimorphilus gyrociliatus TaxID=2664684 RepID=A0A7I8VJ60_9ANNE|nr:DgyrCDS5007 [Dimorphilus gyrociliatus]